MRIETLERIVWRLANSGPVRYFLDPYGDQSYSHMLLEVWIMSPSPGVKPLRPERLDKELAALGFTADHPDFPDQHRLCDIHHAFRYLVEREK